MLSTSPTLLQRLRSPDNATAWDRFVELYTPFLWHLATRTGMAASEVGDFVQDVFVALLEKLPNLQYDRNGSFRAWLRTVLQNKWRDALRRRAARPIAGELTVDPIALADEPTFGDQEHQAFLTARAMELMKRDFEESTWKACWAVVVEGRKAEDVARELRLTVNAVYVAKSRVLRFLRNELQGLWD